MARAASWRCWRWRRPRWRAGRAAISVLSAVEGLEIAAPKLAPYVIPITLAVLIGLFVAQKWGTAGIGKVFGPVMVAWFGILAVSGLFHLLAGPAILAALNPFAGLAFC